MSGIQYQNGIAVAHLIDESGIVEIIADATRSSTRGRQTNVAALRLYLIGQLLAVHTERTGTVEASWEALEKLDVAQKLAIGFHMPRNDNDWIGERVTNLRTFYRWSQKIGDGLAYGDAGAPDLDAETRTSRRRAVQDAVTGGLGVFGPWWEGNVVVVDATAIHAWGRSPFTPDMASNMNDEDDEDDEDEDGVGVDTPIAFAPESSPSEPHVPSLEAPEGREVFDPDALWALKTKPNGDTERFYGYFEHCFVLLVGAQATKAPVDPYMRLIVGLEVTPATSKTVIETSLGVIDRLPIKVATLIGDRAYSNAKVWKWKDQLLARNIDVVIDLRENQHGFIEVEGARCCDGDFFCPGTPDKYGHVTKPGPNAPLQDLIAFKKKIQEREPYRAQRHSGLNADNKVRSCCPSRSGKIGCKLVPGSLEVAIQLGQRIVENPPDPNSPEGLPKICTQSTVALALPDPVRKIWQKYTWGMPIWFHIFGWRSYVEGVFGERKNRSAENMNRGIFRINGVARVNLTALFTAMSHNLRAIRRDNELRNTHSPEHPLFIPVGDTHTVAIPADLDTSAVADPGANHPKSSQGTDSA